MSKLKDLRGMKFGRLTVIERAENKGAKVCWRCKCDCGQETVVQSWNLTHKHTKSCGCIQDETFSLKHGLSHTKIYDNWNMMKQRCLNPNIKSYSRYGGRGITVYPEWVDDFQNFYEYVSKLEHFGEKGYSLDRIDNDGDYCVGNVRWADQKTQGRNRRSNIIVEYEGEQMTLVEASELSGIEYHVLNIRYRTGDRGERLFRPVKK